MALAVLRPVRRQAVVALGLMVSAGVIAAAATAAGAAPALGGWLLVLGWLVAAGGTLVLARTAARQLSGMALQRSLLVVGVVLLQSAIAGVGWPAWFAASLLVCSAAAERVLDAEVRFVPPAVAHLPGVAGYRPRFAAANRAMALATLLAIGVGVALALVGAAGWGWLVAAVLSAVPYALVIADGRAKARAERRLRREVPRAVAAYGPEFVVHSALGQDASHQITMWLPYLERAGRRFVVITRHRKPARALSRLTTVPVIEARRVADLEAMLCPSMKAAFYVNASAGNGLLVRFRGLTHVFLGHGDSDKPTSWNPTHAMYDKIFAAGPVAARRYARHGIDIPAEHFEIVGRPQVEGIRRAESTAATPPANRTVLYAPTWRGQVVEMALSSLADGERIVAALIARGLRVVFRPHPFSSGYPDDLTLIIRIRRLLEADRRATGRDHVWGEKAERTWSLVDCMNGSDALVSDVSSVLSDYLFSEKPFCVVAAQPDLDDFVSRYPIAAAGYVVQRDLGNLEQCLDDALGADPLAPQRRSARIDYLGDIDAEGYADHFTAAVKGVVDERPPSTEESETGGDDPSPSGAVANRRRLIAELGSLALTLAGFACALFGLGWSAAGLALAGLALSVLGIWPRGEPLAGQRDLVTGGLPTRAVALGIAVLIGTAGAASTGVGGWVATAVLLASAAAAELGVVAAARVPRLQAHDLVVPGPTFRAMLPTGLLPLAAHAVFALAVVAASARLPVAVAIAPAAALLTLAGLVVLETLRAAGVGAMALRRVRDGVSAYAPTFVAYFASRVGATYQLGMWLPYFARIGQPWIIVTREASVMEEIAAVTAAQGIRVPIVVRHNNRDLESVLVPGLTAAFYPNNADRNTHFIEHRELTHVWLNHGDSEKPAAFNPVHAIYDLIFAAGQATIDRYARHDVQLPADKFRVVGRPQAESIQPIAPVAGRPACVLYAPTWQGPYADSRLFSLPVGRQIVDHLLSRGVRVIFRSHLFNYRYPECVRMISDIHAGLAADAERTGLDHVFGSRAEVELSIADCFNLSDAMISDVSSVVADYLQSLKPYAIVLAEGTSARLLAEAPIAAAGYLVASDLANLGEACDKLLGGDPLAGDRQELRTYYLGDFPRERYADGFLDAARRVIAAGPRTGPLPDDQQPQAP